MLQILTVDGRTITGVVVNQNEDNITLMSNALTREPTVVPQDEIEEIFPSSVSMMPEALLDQYSQDEIFELMAFLESFSPNRHPSDGQ